MFFCGMTYLENEELQKMTLVFTSRVTHCLPIFRKVTCNTNSSIHHLCIDILLYCLTQNTDLGQKQCDCRRVYGCGQRHGKVWRTLLQILLFGNKEMSGLFMSVRICWNRNTTLQNMSIPTSDVLQAYRSNPEKTEEAMQKVSAQCKHWSGSTFCLHFFI